MSCDTNQLTALQFCVPHPKPHGARGLSKHYNLSFDPKIGHGICEIQRIPCGFMASRKRNRHTNNLSPSVLIGQFWDNTKLEYHRANTKINTF